MAAKPTQAELEERIEFTAKLLAARYFKGDIKRALVARYSVDARTCERYLSRARELLIEWSGKSKDEHRNDALAFYESIIRSDASPADRMTAQGRIDKLLGLEAPQQHSGPGGGPVPISLVEVILTEARDEANGPAGSPA